MPKRTPDRVEIPDTEVSLADLLRAVVVLKVNGDYGFPQGEVAQELRKVKDEPLVTMFAGQLALADEFRRRGETGQYYKLKERLPNSYQLENQIRQQMGARHILSPGSPGEPRNKIADAAAGSIFGAFVRLAGVVADQRPNSGIPRQKGRARQNRSRSSA